MRTSTSYLIVLDGKTMNERARVVAPVVVNFGLHNYFFYENDEEVAKRGGGKKVAAATATPPTPRLPSRL